MRSQRVLWARHAGHRIDSPTASKFFISQPVETVKVSVGVYLSDAIQGILTILHKGTPGQAYNVCNDRETRTVREVAELVAKEVTEESIRVRVEIPEASMGYAPNVQMYLNSDKLRSFGWTTEADMVEAYRRLRDDLRKD